MKYFKYLMVLPALIKIVSSLIEEAEESNMSGPEKAKAVLDAAEKIWETVILRQWPVLRKLPVQSLTDNLQSLIDIGVSFKNGLGLFQKKKHA